MINERAEYRALLSEGYEGLLEKMDGKDFAGLNHDFVTLARGMDEKLGKTPIASDGKKRYRCLVEFLEVWFAGGFFSKPCYEEIMFYEDIFEDFKAADTNNLMAYMQRHQKVGDSVDVLVAKKLKEFHRSMFNKEGRHAIRFAEVIADAHHMGPLKHEVLLIKGQRVAEKDFLKDNTFGIRWVKTNNEVNATLMQRKKILAIVAFYLQNKMDGQQYVELCNADIGNYLGMESTSNGGLGGVADFINKGVFRYEGRPIFHRLSLKQTSILSGKMTVDEKWLADFGVRLWPASEPIPEGYVAIGDNELKKKAQELPQKGKKKTRKRKQKKEAER